MRLFKSKTKSKELIKILKDNNIAYEFEKGKLSIKESLDLRGKNIKKLPDNMEIYGDIDLTMEKIDILPNNLKPKSDDCYKKLVWLSKINLYESIYLKIYRVNNKKLVVLHKFSLRYLPS